MKIQSSPPAVGNKRVFRAERVPLPLGIAPRQAGEALLEAIALGKSIDLEIGCGVGWHPIQYAQENPDRVLVAIERTREKFEKFEERLSRHPTLPNLIPVHADAVAWITHFVPANTFEKVFLLYPNPNPKNPQARWIRMPFFSMLLDKWRSGGRIEIRTNIEKYADEVEAGATEWNLIVESRKRFSREGTPEFQGETHFEQKYLARGETCYSVTLVSMS